MKQRVTPMAFILSRTCSAFLPMMLMMSSLPASAQDMMIRGKVVIDVPTVYTHSTIHLHNGSFIVTKNASLTITDSTIDGTLTPESASLFDVDNGKLVLNNNSVKITSHRIPETPLSAPKYSLIHIYAGKTTLTHNFFKIDTPYTAALLMTGSMPTSGIVVSDNELHHFHGGVLIQNSKKDIINRNTFFRVSCGNIYIKNSSDIDASENTIFFSGNNNVGDGFDIIDSNDIHITGNHIYNGSCYSVFCMRSSHITIADNTITGGITYAVYATDTLSTAHPGQVYLRGLLADEKKSLLHQDNADITVTGNYFSQNRYGLAASHVNRLCVKNNIFIQSFKNKKIRQFWTNNDVLLKNINGLIWSNNQYKEAFSQETQSDNRESLKLVTFPEHNGVVLE